MSDYQPPRILIYGADTPIGNRLRELLRQAGLRQAEITHISRPSNYLWGKADVADLIAAEIADKHVTAVVNCMLDCSNATTPQYPEARYLSPSHAILEQCRVAGLHLIQVSSSRVYGQTLQMQNRTTYSEYDPTFNPGHGNPGHGNPGHGNPDIWRSILDAVEKMLYQQTSAINGIALIHTEPSFNLHLLRFGYVVEAISRIHQQDGVNSISHCLQRMVQSGQTQFVTSNQAAKLSLITAQQAAKCIYELLTPPLRIPSGTYHIASPDYTTVSQLFQYASQRIGKTAQLAATFAGSHHTPMSIDGACMSQALDTGLWQSRSETKLLKWKSTIDKVLGQHATLPAFV